MFSGFRALWEVFCFLNLAFPTQCIHPSGFVHFGPERQPWPPKEPYGGGGCFFLSPERGAVPGCFGHERPGSQPSFSRVYIVCVYIYIYTHRQCVWLEQESMLSLHSGVEWILENGRRTVSRGLFRKRELTEFCGKTIGRN